MPVHATSVALDDARLGLWAVLLRGPSGAGKSDLALRLIDRGAVLVSDDQTLVRAAEGRLLAAPPATIAGQLEVRGLGMARVPHRAGVPVALVADLCPQAQIERLPEPAEETLMGIALRRIQLDPTQVSAPEKLRLALRQAAARIMRAVDGDVAGATAAGETGKGMSDETLLDEVRRAAAPPPGATRVVLVTGMSGAGRSTALRVLEDEGYEAIDNLPLSLINAVVNEVGLQRPVAIGVDVRNRDFAVGPVLAQIDGLAADSRFALSLLFVDCDDEVLGRRYTETRRRHPLAQGRPVADGIALERRLVAPLRERADVVIDTSSLTPAALRGRLLARFGLAGTQGMAVFITSFSYRYGLPREADVVFDVRFLANPYYDPALRLFSGQDAEVADYVAGDPAFSPFFARLTEMLDDLLPRYEREGKSYLTIGIGCTGGRHRSVFVAERLAAWLCERSRLVHLTHRDVAREAARADAAR